MPSGRCVRCRAAWRSGPRSPGRSSTSPGYSCSTSRLPGSTWPPQPGSARCWPSCAGRAAWSCWQPTTWTRASSWPPMWRSSGAAGSCTSRRAAGAGRPRSPTSTGGLSERAVGDWLSQAWTVARKDLLLEFRTRTAIVSALVFTALVLTLFNFGRDPTAVPTIDLAPTILWVTFTFAAMLAMNRAFQLELENDALEGLLASPLSRTSLYWGKLLANLVFVAVVEVVGLPLFVLFFDVPVAPVLGPLIAVIALATVGFVAVGTLFSALVIRTRFAELLLVVLLLPFLLPPLIGAVQVTARLLGGRPLSESAGWLRLLAAYDIAFVTLATLLFPFTVEE
ncbi:MAG: hypothetical protein DMD51_11940 [Gemmatimonadetes bacterium]|nr:MAG: hypothetical protein DMD51_11940 [Gemmatimonadota bacterium]